MPRPCHAMLQRRRTPPLFEAPKQHGTDRLRMRPGCIRSFQAAAACCQQGRHVCMRSPQRAARSQVLPARAAVCGCACPAQLPRSARQSACRPRKYWHVQPAPAARPVPMQAGGRPLLQGRRGNAWHASVTHACLWQKAHAQQAAASAGMVQENLGRAASPVSGVPSTRGPFLAISRLCAGGPRASSKRRSSTSKARACSLLRHRPYRLTRPHAVPAPWWRP